LHNRPSGHRLIQPIISIGAQEVGKKKSKEKKVKEDKEKIR
jgi:hypothetical protein